ncbi:glycosyltransferase [Clostridiaceae bacterium M8S5]|nr:glycosyltransferase [Clostridiaceae bacterium M8S5]
MNKNIYQVLLKKKRFASKPNIVKKKMKTNSGVSIITVTNKSIFMTNLFNNYSRQLHKLKELIIIVNNTHLQLETYRKKASNYKNVKIFKLPSNNTLGRCLNYAISKAKYPIIAKFDDDDYYSPKYLTYNLNKMVKTDADVIGKKAHLVYFKALKTLAIRHPGNENKYVNFVNGSTLFFKKAICKIAPFRNVNAAEDVIFCKDCLLSGIRIFSASRNHHIYIRYPSKANHTWKIGDKELLNKFCMTLKRNVDLNQIKKEQSQL